MVALPPPSPITWGRPRSSNRGGAMVFSVLVGPRCGRGVGKKSGWIGVGESFYIDRLLKSLECIIVFLLCLQLTCTYCTV